MCEPIACCSKWLDGCLAGWLVDVCRLPGHRKEQKSLLLFAEKENRQRREAGVQIWRCSELAGSLGGTLVSLIGVSVASAWVPCDLQVAPCGAAVLNRNIGSSSALDAGAAPGAWLLMIERPSIPATMDVSLVCIPATYQGYDIVL